MRIELTRVGLLVYLVNHYTTWGAHVVEKVCQYPLWGEDCEAGLYGRIAIKKHLLRKQDNVKRFQLAKVHKDWTIEQ